MITQEFSMYMKYELESNSFIIDSIHHAEFHLQSEITPLLFPLYSLLHPLVHFF